MIITVFGATGIVGREIVTQALNKGYQVRAFGRTVFTAPFPKNDQLKLIQGALFDDSDVFNAIKGSDIVLSAIGGAVDGTDLSRSKGMETIIRQMDKAGNKRIIAVGGMGVLDNNEGQLLLHSAGYPSQYLAVGEEHLKAYKALKASNLVWTFIGCADIIPGGSTGLFNTSAETLPQPNKYKIKVGDLALFMLNEIDKNNYLCARVGISN